MRTTPHPTGIALLLSLVFGLAAAVPAAASGGGRDLAVPEQEPAPIAIDPLSPAVLHPSVADAARVEQEVSKNYGGSSPLVIPAAAFAGNGNYAGTYYFHAFFGYMQGKSGTDGCVVAPAPLPNGARVTSLRASIWDEDLSQDVIVQLMRSDNLSWHAADQMATIQSTGSPGYMQVPNTTVINFPDVSFPRYHFYVTLCLPSYQTKLYSVRIYFEGDELFSDSFESGDTRAWTADSP